MTSAASPGAPAAALAYPPSAPQFRMQAGRVAVHRVGFRLDGDLEGEAAAFGATGGSARAAWAVNGGPIPQHGPST